MAEPQAAAVAAKSRGGRSCKPIEKTLENYDVWVKDDNPIEEGQKAKLQNDIDHLCKANAEWVKQKNRPACELEEAKRYLDKMRRKLVEAKQNFGRYTKKAAAVDEAAAQLEKSDEVQEWVQTEMDKGQQMIRKGLEKVKKAQNVGYFNHQATASAGRAAIQTTNELLAGEPNEPLSEAVDVAADAPLVEDAVAAPRVEATAVAPSREKCRRATEAVDNSSAEDEQRKLKRLKVADLRQQLGDRGLETNGTKEEMIKRLTAGAPAASAGTPASDAGVVAAAASIGIPAGDVGEVAAAASVETPASGAGEVAAAASVGTPAGDAGVVAAAASVGTPAVNVGNAAAEASVGTPGGAAAQGS